MRGILQTKTRERKGGCMRLWTNEEEGEEASPCVLATGKSPSPGSFLAGGGGLRHHPPPRTGETRERGERKMK
jgi:hypothetical protein